MLQSRNIIVDGLDVRYYQNERQGPALIFLHGWGSEALSFRRVLENHPGAIALDLPGFGRSQTPHGAAWSLDDYVTFLGVFLDRIGSGPFTLVGHSFGGSIAIRYAARHTGVERLVLIGSAGIRHKDTLRKTLWLVLARLFGWILRLPGVSVFRRRIRKRLYDRIGGEDYFEAGVLRETYSRIVGQDVQDDARQVKVPVTLIWGENDTSTPLEDAYRFHTLFRRSRLEVIPQAGHYVFLDAPQPFQEAFTRALR